MRFKGYSANGVEGDACWFCEGCKRIHVLPYRIGRSRQYCYACQKVKREELTGSIKNNVVDPAIRICLMCGKEFQSTNKGNRRCARCEYKLQHDAFGRHSNKNAMRFVAAGKMFETSSFLTGFSKEGWKIFS